MPTNKPSVASWRAIFAAAPAMSAIVNAVASVIEKRNDQTGMPAATAHAPAAAFTTFEPAAPAPVASRAAASARTAANDVPLRPGWTRFDESFVIKKPRAEVWELFNDVRRVASYLPGVEVTDCGDTNVKGRMVTKLGPIAASFAGSAAITRDPANWSGTIVGAGSDGGSGSRTRGEVAYKLDAVDQDAATRVAISVQYNLQGSLAQFSRSSLAQEFARQLVARFAANCSAQLGGAPAAIPDSSLHVGSLVRIVVGAWLKRIFCRAP